jgi:MFS family permease
MLAPSSWFKDRLFDGWVVVATFLFIGVTLYGIYLSFGVFFKSIEYDFQLTRAVTSAIVSTNLMLSGVFSFGAGWALDRYGPRIVVLLMGLVTGLSLLLTSQATSLWHVFVTYGLLLALGTGPLFVVPMSTVCKWFDKKRGLALGIAGLGLGLGPMFMAPFATYLISNYSWRVAYIVIGLLAWLTILPLSRLLKKDPRAIGALPDGVTEPPSSTGFEDSATPQAGLVLSQVLRTRSFWAAMVIWLFYAANSLSIMTHLVPHVTDIGFSPLQAASVLSTIGAAAIFGRVLTGIISDRAGRKLTSVICALLQAGAMTWLLWSQDLWNFYLFAAVYGFTYGGMSVAFAALIGDTFGVGRIGTMLGILEIGFGIGAGVGPFLGGLIFDINNSYFFAFLLGAIAMATVTLLIGSIRKEYS